MPGPCPNGNSPLTLHTKCQDRGNCTGPGCRVRRNPRVEREDHAPDLEAS